MRLYCGIDLHSTMSWLVVLDEESRVVEREKVLNDLYRFDERLRPHKANLEEVVVESTYKCDTRQPVRSCR
jgi:hypothetical protein